MPEYVEEVVVSSQMWYTKKKTSRVEPVVSLPELEPSGTSLGTRAGTLQSASSQSGFVDIGFTVVIGLVFFRISLSFYP